MRSRQYPGEYQISIMAVPAHGQSIDRKKFIDSINSAINTNYCGYWSDFVTDDSKVFHFGDIVIWNDHQVFYDASSIEDAFEEYLNGEASEPEEIQYRVIRRQ